MRIGDSSMCVLYRIYHGEFSREQLYLVPTAEFPNRTVRHKFNTIHYLYTWHSITLFQGRYDMGIFKKRVYLHWCYTGLWAAVITYHQMTLILFCIIFFIKKTNMSVQENKPSILSLSILNFIILKCISLHKKKTQYVIYLIER